jgi:hypothetical protein
MTTMLNEDPALPETLTGAEHLAASGCKTPDGCHGACLPEPARDYATWYQVSIYGAPTINPVRVLRETPHQIFLADCSPGNARRAKADTYFKTWEAAHDYLMSVVQRELDMARLALARAQGRHGNVKGMKPNVRANLPPVAAQE